VTAPRNSLVVPVYRNAMTIAALVRAVDDIREQVDGGLEVIFVVDGSPDDSLDRLIAECTSSATPSRVVEHSRNFGSFAAIRTGLRMARGERMAVMAADLQEPPELVIEFFARLATQEADIVAGARASRSDAGDSASKIYWRLYRRFVIHDIPAGGVDMFACTAQVRDVLCSMEQAHTSLVGQLFWAGFRRETVAYDRRPQTGESGWTFARKVQYLSDSVFAFTDLPVKVLWGAGLAGLSIGVAGALVVLIARITGGIRVPGYAATVLIVLLFLSINSVGLGIIGSYVWRAYETVKGRPGAIVRDVIELPGATDGD
jgi:glycosyltransferase involved in cell wall biosynthesis